MRRKSNGEGTVWDAGDGTCGLKKAQQAYKDG
jgi:hypothetical protein